MLLVQRTAPGHIELNWSWLPTWIGMNTALLRDIEDAVMPKLAGQALDDALLERAHNLVILYLQERYANIQGVDDYLDGIKFVVLSGAAV